MELYKGFLRFEISIPAFCLELQMKSKVPSDVALNFRWLVKNIPNI